ncbi:MAG: glutathione synthase/RimK-type ligase-like ATP-grasp enzyme [Natrialbaceae archaeon]|jgi:glutathione synthase/RimK-type ligase-like ATP-grasp enzyme
MSEPPSTLAIVTGRFAPNLSDGGKKVAATLADRGISSEPVMWTDQSVEWNSYDAVLLRSCWDYPEDRGRFRAMLGEIERAGIPVCNPLSVIRWNLHKSYLTALADAGVQIPPTVVLEPGTDTSLENVLRTHGWEEAVVKPAIGAMSSQVWRTAVTEVGEYESQFDDLVGHHDVVVQEFVPEITDGERSIVFFGGEYSHAWNSLPTDDDITEFDGNDADYEPSSAIRAQAATAVQAACDILEIQAGSHLPYARVDYVHRESELLLMELELIEPYLGFERGEDTIDRFCDAIVSFFQTALED